MQANFQERGEAPGPFRAFGPDMHINTTIVKWTMAAIMGLTPLVAIPQATRPDNTKNNAADREANGPTADQAKNNKSDRENMQLIRRALMADKSLSRDAHNVKIIADHGKVTLKGPVRSEEEKQTIQADAAKVAGTENVDNQITVKSNAADRTNPAPRQ